MKFLPAKNPKGFTLIEMLVSIALFATIAVMALGALLSLSVADRRAEAMKSAMDNLTFALDSMSRTIRTGSVYHCGSGGTYASAQDCTSGGTFLTLLTANGTRVYYQYDTTNCGTGYTSCIERSFTGISGSWTPITSPDIVFTNTTLFFVTGSSAVKQPAVIITVKGYVQISSVLQNAFTIQTTIAQRIYDL